MSETKRPTMVKILAVIVFIGSVLPILGDDYSDWRSL